MKPMRGNRLRMKGWRRVIQMWRACRTSGRFCSTARRAFLVTQPEAAQEPPDRDAVDRDAVPIRQFDHQIVERQVAFLRHPRFEPPRTGSNLPCPPPLPCRSR